ncbi:gene transfer agent family protein [Rhizobium sp.]
MSESSPSIAAAEATVVAAPKHFAEIKLPFAEDPETVFCLRNRDIADWERANDASLMATFRYMVEHRAGRAAHIREFIRLGLIGAGMPPVEAMRAVIRYVDEYPIADNFSAALAIVEAALYGTDEHRAQIAKAAADA